MNGLAELLERSAAGDQHAFATLYDHTAARVFGLCHRLLRDHAGAEDLTQEIFLEVWTKAARFDPTRGSVIGWMLQMTHHRAVDRIRTAESVRRRDTAHAAHEQDRPDVHVDHRIMVESNTRRLWEAINTLSPLRREALRYAYFTDYSHQQASDLLQIPLGTFKSRVRDAVLALHPLLAG